MHQIRFDKTCIERERKLGTRGAGRLDWREMGHRQCVNSDAMPKADEKGNAVWGRLDVELTDQLDVRPGVCNILYERDELGDPVHVLVGSRSWTA